jgi:Protein of unknown function (DUF554)
VRGAGTLINIAAVLAGSAAGVLIGTRLPDRVRITVIQGLGVFTTTRCERWQARPWYDLTAVSRERHG